ncbi:Sec-independent protein translocase subunit TatA [Georgenia sunbinii]|uniref:Sec-independent protein translocase subunit TatA n=1 Tax=Georgenia sunbinii TaxID=3117728 RepID=UPI002F2619EA
MRLQFWHILIIVLVIVILFGARRLPDVASSVGKSLKIFKKEINELREDDDTYAPGGTTAGHVPPPTSATPVDGTQQAPRTGTTPPAGGSGSSN